MQVTGDNNVLLPGGLLAGSGFGWPSVSPGFRMKPKGQIWEIGLREGPEKEKECENELSGSDSGS